MFYVYGWFLQDGQCFYIGKGSGYRYRERQQRNDRWHEVVETEKLEGRFVSVRLIYSNLIESDAFRLEAHLIDQLKP